MGTWGVVSARHQTELCKLPRALHRRGASFSLRKVGTRLAEWFPKHTPQIPGPAHTWWDRISRAKGPGICIWGTSLMDPDGPDRCTGHHEGAPGLETDLGDPSGPRILVAFLPAHPPLILVTDY